MHGFRMDSVDAVGRMGAQMEGGDGSGSDWRCCCPIDFWGGAECVLSEEAFVKCQKKNKKNQQRMTKNISPDVKRSSTSIRFSLSDSGSFYCLLFVEPLDAEGLDDCRLLGKIRFHVMICLPPLPPSPLSMPFGNIPSSVISLLCHLISISRSPWPFRSLSALFFHLVLFSPEQTVQHKGWF